jgi:hypothetical protein
VVAAAEVRMTPDRTIEANEGSVATSQCTRTAGPSPEPGVAAGIGVTRVHSTTLCGNGSPEATP